MIAAIHARLNTKAVDRALHTQAAVVWPGAGSRSAAGVDAGTDRHPVKVKMNRMEQVRNLPEI